MKQCFYILLSLVCLPCVSCSDNDSANSADQPRKEIALSRSQQDIVDSQARFAFDFFKAASKYSDPENMAISPISLSLDLAMLANGGGEQTYNDIMAAMHTPGVTAEEFNALYSTLMSGLLNADPKVELTIANSMWCDKEFDIKGGFAKNIFDNYDANIDALDFNNPDNVKAIVNRWTSEKTNGKITDIFDNKEDLCSSKFLLCNALYFNGKWTTPFKENKTSKRVFTNIDHSESCVMTMCSSRAGFYAWDEIANVVKLPYGNGAFSLYIILPELNDDIHNYHALMNQFVENLDYDWWRSIKGRLRDESIELYLPKFKIYTKYSHIGMSFFEALRNIVSFPDLSLMTDKMVPVIQINQFNCIDVSEKGTEAASVTKFSGGETSYLPSGVMEINRPFIFLIEEYSTGAILFMGKVTKLGE